MSHTNYLQLVQKELGVPYLTLSRKMKYYTVSYFRAIKKRLHVKQLKVAS